MFKKSLALFLTCILMCSISTHAFASENDVSEILENGIETSTILDEADYTVREITSDEIPENVVPLQFDTIEEAITYLEENELMSRFEETEIICATEICGNPLARAKESYICTSERSLTSTYTLRATVDVDNSTKKILNTYDMSFELSGVTICIGIDNVNIYPTYYDNDTRVRVRADYQHVTYIIVHTSTMEVARSNCYHQMYYTYDTGCYGTEFGYR